MIQNLLTEIESALKSFLGNPAYVSLNGEAVPVRIVTPDPDLVELELPTTTIQLIDIRRGLDRSNNEFKVQKPSSLNEARVVWPDAPYDLFYTIRSHTTSSRDDRLLFYQYLRLVDAHPILPGASGRRFYIARSLSFRDRSRKRTFERALTYVIKVRSPSTVETIVPLVHEHLVHTHITDSE